MRKVNKNDEYIRRAIYEVHGKKCFYTGDPLIYRDMQLDHIIPEDLKKNEEKLNRILEYCGLEKGFELDSLYNLVPTTRFENRRKSDSIYSDSRIMHYIERTTQMVPKIEAKILKLKKDENFDRDISMVKAHIDNTDTKIEKDRVIEKLVCFINNEAEDFSECEEIYQFEQRRIYKKYTKRIGIEAILPEYNNCEVECMLYFKTLKISDCKIILDNETILKELFSGLYTDPIHGIRGFIEHSSDLNKDLTPEDFGAAEIRLGDNRLKLIYEDICLLCEVADSLAKVYISEITNIEKLLKTSMFTLSKRHNSYKFLSVNPDEWIKMYRFANKYDVDKGISRWHIFDKKPTYSTIAIYTDKKHPIYKPGYHSFFTVEKDEDSIFYPSIASNKFVITWQFIEDIDKQGVEFLNEKENWDAEYAYNWLINEFMPKAGVEYKKKKFFNKKSEELGDFFENNKVEYTTYIKKDNVLTENDLKNALSNLQGHFYCRPKYKYRIKKEDFKMLYAVLHYCICNSKKVDKYYICDKLSLEKSNSKDDIIKELENLKSSITEKTVLGYDIDLVFRVLVALFEDNTFSLDKKGINNIFEGIGSFIDIYNRETLIDKYAISYLAW